jgi:hypothetical protein
MSSPCDPLHSRVRTTLVRGVSDRLAPDDEKMAGEEVRKVSARSEVEMRAAVPEYEEKRLALLSLYQIMDRGADPIYDNITQIAAQIAQTPIALISIVDRGRQWFKWRIGLAVSETPRKRRFALTQSPPSP